MKIDLYNPLIYVLLEQGYTLEEISGIIAHINQEICRGIDVDDIFNLYNLDIDLLEYLHKI